MSAFLAAAAAAAAVTMCDVKHTQGSLLAMEMQRVAFTGEVETARRRIAEAFVVLGDGRHL